MCRISFSLSLLKHIIEELKDNTYKIVKTSIIHGRSLDTYEISTTGLYGIVSAKSNKILRVTLFKELAELFRDNSRYIIEVYLDEKQSTPPI